MKDDALAVLQNIIAAARFDFEAQIKLALNARDPTDNLHGSREAIEKAVPHGRTNHGGTGDKGAWHDFLVRTRTCGEQV